MAPEGPLPVSLVAFVWLVESEGSACLGDEENATVEEDVIVSLIPDLGRDVETVDVRTLLDIMDVVLVAAGVVLVSVGGVLVSEVKVWVVDDADA